MTANLSRVVFEGMSASDDVDDAARDVRISVHAHKYPRIRLQLTRTCLRRHVTRHAAQNDLKSSPIVSLVMLVFVVNARLDQNCSLLNVGLYFAKLLAVSIYYRLFLQQRGLCICVLVCFRSYLVGFCFLLVLLFAYSQVFVT